MRKAVLLYNPLAGTGQERRRAVIAAVEDVLRSAGIETVMEPTHGPAEAGDQARHFAEKGCDTIFACGGDGTLLQAAHRFRGSGIPIPDSVPIAFLPEINYYDILSEKLQWRGDGLSKPKYGHA